VKRSTIAPLSLKLKFYRVGELAELLGVSERSIWRFIKNGELPVHKFGRAIRVSHPDYAAFVAIHRDD
jgi:excisionase family DNA binding protein